MDVPGVQQLLQLKGRRVYELADLVESCVDAPSTITEIFFGDPDISWKLAKPCKVSILCHYIFRMVWVERNRDYRKNGDLYDEDYAEDLRQLALEYGIHLTSYGNFCSDQKTYKKAVADLGMRQDEAPFYIWFLNQEDSVSELWEEMTDEVFHLLFGNRRFLLNFNLSLSEYLRVNPVLLPPDSVTSRGRLKRASHMPRWLKSAVYCRDHGRCVLCQRDLTGLLSVDRAIHYDHMVPLERFGTNDPVNFQMLCASCNIRKAAAAGATSYHYPAWWR